MSREAAHSALRRLDPIMDNLLRENLPVFACGATRAGNRSDCQSIASCNKPSARSAGVVSPARKTRCSELFHAVLKKKHRALTEKQSARTKNTRPWPISQRLRTFTRGFDKNTCASG